MEIEEEFSVKDLFEEKKPEPKQEKPAKPAKKEKPAKQEPKKAEKPQPVKEVKEEPKAEEVKAEVKEEPKAAEASLEEIPAAEASAKVKYAMEFIQSIIGQFYESEYEFKIFKTHSIISLTCNWSSHNATVRTKISIKGFEIFHIKTREPRTV